MAPRIQKIGEQGQLGFIPVGSVRNLLPRPAILRQPYAHSSQITGWGHPGKDQCPPCGQKAVEFRPALLLDGDRNGDLGQNKPIPKDRVFRQEHRAHRQIDPHGLEFHAGEVPLDGSGHGFPTLRFALEGIGGEAKFLLQNLQITAQGQGKCVSIGVPGFHCGDDLRGLILHRDRDVQCPRHTLGEDVALGQLDPSHRLISPGLGLVDVAKIPGHAQGFLPALLPRRYKGGHRLLLNRQPV